jgi:hypothetical protein
MGTRADYRRDEDRLNGENCHPSLANLGLLNSRANVAIHWPFWLLFGRYGTSSLVRYAAPRAQKPTYQHRMPRTDRYRACFPSLARFAGLPRIGVDFSWPRSLLGRGWGGVFNKRKSNLSRRWLSVWSVLCMIYSLSRSRSTLPQKAIAG